MIALRLLVIACCATLCMADEWSWTCGQVPEQQNVDINKLLGRWYYVEWIVPGKIKDDHFCRVLNISRTGNSPVLLLQYNDTIPNEGHRISNVRTTLLSPSKLLSAGLSQKVVDLSQDGGTLAISYCNPSVSTAVFSRKSGTDLAPLHDRLQRAGVAGVDQAEAFDRTGCPADKTSGAGFRLTEPGTHVLLVLLLYLSRAL